MLLVLLSILRGYPIAFTLGGVSILFALGASFLFPGSIDMQDLHLLPFRIMGVVNNFVLMAVPLFIFMGIVLQKAGLAEELLDIIALLLGKIRGGLAVSVIVVGTLLAASTAIVGATVVTMGLIALPAMIKRGYNPGLATGIIASCGTLGQIIPPSIVLILLAHTVSSYSTESIDVGQIFRMAFVAGGVLVLAYALYVLAMSYLKKGYAPKIAKEERREPLSLKFALRLIKGLMLPFTLILAVLGSIFFGVASPTEAAGIGAMGAILLAAAHRRLGRSMLIESLKSSVHLTAMVFFILLGASTFSLVFKSLGGDDYIQGMILGAELQPLSFLILVMGLLFLAGFVIDFIEIIFIFVPIVAPIFDALGMDMLWISILIALNIQTSFLTPPFGFSLFYLKGVVPHGISTRQIYLGAIPFVIIQVVVIALFLMKPELLYIFETP